MKKFILTLLMVISIANTNLVYSTTVYSDTTTFYSHLDIAITDDYENPDYTMSMTDSEMNAVFGETTYHDTAFGDFGTHMVNDTHFNPSYSGIWCNGCNGSTLLGFDSTSISVADSVFGVGLDILGNGSSRSRAFSAFVTFGNGSTQNFQLPEVDGGDPATFWGLTSDLGIRSMHIADNNVISGTGLFGLDSLIIGSVDGFSPVPSPVPLPATFWFMGSALLGLFGFFRKSKAQTVDL